MQYKRQLRWWEPPISNQHFTVLVFLVCLVNLTSAKVPKNPSRDMDALKAVSESNLNFTTALYKVLAKQQGNLFFSPVSIEVILALAYMGARGKTAQQMETGLCLPADKEISKAGFHSLITTLKSDENITLDIANKIYTDARVKLQHAFLSTAQKSFVSDVETVDFVTKFDEARVAINGWVESKTNNKIKDLLASGTLTSDTIMVLVNAVYFKGDWASKFEKSRTDTQPFHVSATETKDVQMMHIKKKFGYTIRDDLDAKVLEMPYAGDKLSLVIILPNAVDGLAKLEAKLPEVNLAEILGDLGKPEVEVSLPKFKLEQMFDLKDVLQEMGMVDMFEDNADFTGLMSEGPPVKVSKVVHKAFIEVNEEGSEAAAATAAVMQKFRSGGRLRTQRKIFKADHPFVFSIVNRRSATTLFMGQLSSPPMGVHKRKSSLLPPYKRQKVKNLRKRIKNKN